MSELRFLSSSDEHNSDLNPGFRKDNYREAIFSKLAWQGEMAEKFGATAVLRAGDFWHVKAANKTTIASIIRAIKIHRKYPCPTYSMMGNHDMSNNDPDTIDKQPLGVMLKSGVFRHLRDEIFTSGSMSVRVLGVDYTSDLADEGLRSMVRKKDNHTYTIAFVHALAAMAPEEKIQAFFGEKIFDYRDLVFDGCPDAYVFGHYHKDQGVVDHLGVKFVNLGAISRGALTFENMERKPKVGLIKLNSQGISIEEHIIPHGDASQVFDVARKEKLESVRRGIEEFITKFRANAAMSSDTDIRNRIAAFQKSGDYPADLKALLLETMESAESGGIDD